MVVNQQKTATSNNVVRPEGKIVTRNAIENARKPDKSVKSKVLNVKCEVWSVNYFALRTSHLALGLVAPAGIEPAFKV